MATPVKSPTPRGRDQIVDAVLDAAEALFARSGPAAVSLRDIAAEAGVTYSLINRHVGTKDALLDLLLARYEQRWTAQLGDEPGYDAALDRLLGSTDDAGTYLRLLAWTLLTGHEDEHAAAHQRHAALDRLPALRTGADPAETAAALAFVFGWRFFNPFIRAALHLDDAERSELHEQMRDHLRRMTADRTA